MANLTIDILGTGTSQGVPVINCNCEVCQSKDPKDTRFRSSILIHHKDKSIVVDISPDFRQQLLANPTPKIDAVLFTHEHNDHVAGLDDMRPFVFQQKEDIPLYGLERVMEAIRTRFPYAFGGVDYPGVPNFDVHMIEHGQTVQLDDLEIIPFEVMHGHLPILGYRIKDFVYITDGKTLNEETIEIAKNAKVLIINALRKKKHWTHFNLEECLQMIDILQPEQAYITHISHLMGFHEEVEKELPDNVSLAYDGIRIEL